MGLTVLTISRLSSLYKPDPPMTPACRSVQVRGFQGRGRMPKSGQGEDEVVRSGQRREGGTLCVSVVSGLPESIGSTHLCSARVPATRAAGEVEGGDERMERDGDGTDGQAGNASVSARVCPTVRARRTDQGCVVHGVVRRRHGGHDPAKESG